MKGAAEEANMTVIAIILVGVIAAIAVPLITNMMSSTQKKSECLNQGQCFDSKTGACTPCSGAAE